MNPRDVSNRPDSIMRLAFWFINTCGTPENARKVLEAGIAAFETAKTLSIPARPETVKK